MGQVALTLNGRRYRLACGDGEEERLHQLSECVKGKLDRLVDEFGQVGETRLMVMAALLLADDLLDSKPASKNAEHADVDAASDDRVDATGKRLNKSGA